MVEAFGRDAGGLAQNRFPVSICALESDLSSLTERVERARSLFLVDF